MYEAHFGLHTNPFSPTPTPEFIYESVEYREALAHFRFALENREPFLLLSGEVGTGKTTAIQALRRQLPARAAVAVVNYTTLDTRELLEEIVRRFGLDVAPGESKPSLMHRLERFLADRRRGGDPALLVLDEAHLLSTPLLEEVRLLSNLEDEGGKLLQICLVGQPELDAHLQRTELRQIRQRISVRYALRPLTENETREYIQHRLHAAGAAEPEWIFPEDACAAVFQITQGIPREINVLAGQALLNAFLEDAEQVLRGHVVSARLDYGFEGLGQPPRSVLEGIARIRPRGSAPAPARPPASRPSATRPPRAVERPPVEAGPEETLETGEPSRVAATGGRPLPRPIPLPPPSLRPAQRTPPPLADREPPEAPRASEPPPIQLTPGPGTLRRERLDEGRTARWIAVTLLIVGAAVAGVVFWPRIQDMAGGLVAEETAPEVSEESEEEAADKETGGDEAAGPSSTGRAATIRNPGSEASGPAPVAGSAGSAAADSGWQVPPDPVPPPVAFKAPVAGLIGIQVASLRELARAERLAEEIGEKTGLEASIHGSFEGGSRWYRVFAGAFPSRDEARIGALILIETGFIEEAIFRPIPGRHEGPAAVDSTAAPG